MPLTYKQERVLKFIVMFQKENGYTPTVGDIQRGLGFKSRPAAAGHVRALERKGRIKTTPNIRRSIVIL